MLTASAHWWRRLPGKLDSFRQAIFICLLGFISCGTVLTQPSQGTIKQYVHTAWEKQDGSPGNVWAFAQTPDGFLWVGSNDGLSRFDGSNFERYQAPSGPALPVEEVTALLALSNGDLWIGFTKERVSLLRNGRAVNYVLHDGPPAAVVNALVQDGTGAIWAATSTGLMRFDGNRWTETGKDWGFPGGRVDAVFVDSRGTLWAAAGNTILFLPKGAKAFQPTSIQIGTVTQFAEARNGRLWMAEPTRSVLPLPLGTESGPGNDTEVEVGSIAILFAQDGALWIPTLGDGLLRVPVPEELHGKLHASSASIERNVLKDGLTDNVVQSIFQDREGNIWVGTLTGVDRFRKNSFTPLVTSMGTNGAILIPDGPDMWIHAPTGGLSRVHQSVATVFAPAKKLHMWWLDEAYREPAGAIWWLTPTELLRSEKERFTTFKWPKLIADAFGKSPHPPAAFSEDKSGVLWVAIGEAGLFYGKGDIWSSFDTPAELKRLNPTIAYTDDSGRVWFGYEDGTIACLQDGKIRTLVKGKDSPVGPGGVVFGGHHQRVWLGGGRGLAYLDGDQLIPVSPSDAERFLPVSGIEETADGSLWLREQRGAIHIDSDEVDRFLRSHQYRVHYELFDSLDGLPGSFEDNMKRGEALDDKGRLWVAATKGYAWLDPNNIPKSSPPPPAAIVKVVADGKQIPSQGDPALPPLTTRLEIYVAGLNLSAPERVRCRYEMEGVDRGWQEGGSAPLASYTNLSPGKHRFRLNARNVGGEWNAQDTVMEFSVAPAWFQTLWFKTLCVGFACYILWLFYRIRVRQVAKAISVRFDERLQERTRLARDLHDTLLQTIQASKYAADAAIRRSTDTNPMRSSMEELSEWLGHAIEEGRAAVNSLRTSTTETNDLAQGFKRVLDECRTQSSPEASFAVVGAVREMHPIARDEVFRIGYEAIRNACAHSQATQLHVELTYVEDLILRVRDNGVGIAPTIVDEGKEGHFGLQGMRERAGRIMAKLTVESSQAAGTEIKLVVPGSIIYRGTASGVRKQPFLKSLLKRLGLTSKSTDL